MSPDLSQEHRDLLHKLALAHHAGAAYRALLAAGPAALPTIRDGLRYDSGEVRLRCCQFFDQFLIPEVMDDLLALLDDPDAHVREHAVGLMGRWVHTSPDAAAAVARVHRADLSASVRKKAGMLVPGGVLFRKSMPRPPRAERRRATA